MRRPPTLQAQFLTASLRSLAGSTQWSVVILALLLLLLFSWFTDQLWDVISARKWPDVTQWSALIAFPLSLAVLLYYARSVAKAVVPDVACERVDQNSVQKVACLILFLSPPSKDSESVQHWTSDANLKGCLSSCLGKMQGPWRMPFEGIALHSGRLKHIAVICSADLQDSQDGTWRHFETFRKLARHLLGTDDVDVFNAGARLLDKAGVDFEDAAILVQLVNEVYRHFRELGFKEADILVDITGGQKVPTIAGAAIAMAEGRRFQYVSTRDYKVRLYDVTYKTI